MTLECKSHLRNIEGEANGNSSNGMERVKLGIWVNAYDCPYIDEWQAGIDSQSDRLFNVYSDVAEAVQYNDCVLCLDLDDIPEPRLVWRAKLQAQRYDITGFGMTMFGEIEGEFGKMTDLEEYYCFGFGNTCWRSEIAPLAQ